MSHGLVWVHRHWNTVTNVVALVVALSFLLLGLVLVVAPGISTYRSAGQASQLCRPLRPPCSVRIETIKRPTGQQVTRTVEPLSLQEHLLAGGAGVVLELLLVLLAAFVGGAVMQRMLRGSYAITLGPLAIPQLATKTSQGIKDLNRRTKRLEGNLKAIADSVSQASDGVSALEDLIREQAAAIDGLAKWAGEVENCLGQAGIDIPVPR